MYYVIQLVVLSLVWMTGFNAPIDASADVMPVATIDGQPLASHEIWEHAEACLIFGEELTPAECFKSEGALDERLAGLSEGGKEGAMACTGTIRLYDQPDFGTPMVAVIAGTDWVNLSTHSFDNRASSFRIGNCDAHLAMGVNGGGSLYPLGSTEANDSVASMSSTWNDTISSVRSR